MGLAGQCRPLSKTVRFNVLRVAKSKACDQDVWLVLDELGCTAIGIYDLHAIVAETNKSQTNCVETRGVMRLTDLNHVHFT